MQIQVNTDDKVEGREEWARRIGGCSLHVACGYGSTVVSMFLGAVLVVLSIRRGPIPGALLFSPVPSSV